MRTSSLRRLAFASSTLAATCSRFCTDGANYQWKAREGGRRAATGAMVGMNATNIHQPFGTQTGSVLASLTSAAWSQYEDAKHAETTAARQLQ